MSFRIAEWARPIAVVAVLATQGACGLKEAKEDSAKAETQIAADLGLRAQVTCNMVSGVKGKAVFVTVRTSRPIDQDEKRRVEDIVRRSFREDVTKIDVVM